MRWLLGVLACGLLVVAAFWSTAGDTVPPPASAPLTTPTDADGAAAKADLTAPAPPRTTAEHASAWLEHLSGAAAAPLEAADDDDPEAVLLRGRLTVRQRPWVHPAGVDLRLTRHWLDTVVPTEAPPPDRSPAGREPVATTAADGTFAFRFRPVPGEVFFLIDRGGPWMDYQKVPRLPPIGAELDLGDVLVDDRGSVRGQVVLANDQPLANVTVRAVDDTLSALTNGLEDLRADRTRALEQFTATGSTTFGPLPGWLVRRDLLLPFPTATTDAQGQFELRGLRPGVHDLFCQHAQGIGTLREVQVAELRTTEVGRVRLRDTEAVELVFLDDRAQPWIGAEVAFVHDGPGFGSPPLRTDAAGRIQTRVADLARTRVAFAHPGGGPWRDLGPAIAIGPLVRIPRLPEITLSLSDPLGVALPHGRVRFFVTGVQLRAVDRQLPQWMQPTERQPGLHVGLGEVGTVAVASVPGFAPAIAAVAPGGDNALSLLPLQRVTIRVWDGERRPVAGATIHLQVHQHEDLEFRGSQWELLANDRMRAGITGEDGTLEAPVWATWFSVQASHPEYATSVGPRFLPQPGAIVDLTLRRRAGIHGTLSVQHRIAQAGFRVRARQHAPEGDPLAASGFLAEQLAVTGADGTFAFRDLSAGLWELHPEWPATPSIFGARRPTSAFTGRQVRLDDGQQLHLTLEATRATLHAPQVAGIVRQNGAPMAGALVRVREVGRPRPEARRRPGSSRRRIDPWPEPANPAWPQHCTTDHFGDFDFAGLAVDVEHELRVDIPRDGRLQFLRRLVFRPAPDGSAPVRVDIDLETGSALLQCSHLGHPLAGRMLRLRQVLDGGEDGARFELLTDDLGECVADDLPAGHWTMEPVHGGSLQPAEFTVRARTIVAAVAEFVP